MLKSRQSKSPMVAKYSKSPMQDKVKLRRENKTPKKDFKITTT